MKKLMGRLIDFIHERRINRARDLVGIAMRLSGDEASVRQHWVALVALINARSPEQVKRMERRMGLR